MGILDFLSGQFIDVIHWTDDTRDRLNSFVNGIPTKEGGTHVQGFRDGVVKAMRSFIDTHGLQPRGLTLSADDIREGMVLRLPATASTAN